ncbi:YraN family protein [Brachybacterium sp. ACRRE]|uniref:YraN family protein n=1 Tax=Brachybacterium sp. ACRRE TaxID=2918184 RepID=UPI001EF18349|nr:YraN family protein [Brachybacterium sp. ACRRE]MCG7310693.1 YraN family protein [Brachybacterium sp. ACRRE]
MTRRPAPIPFPAAVPLARLSALELGRIGEQVVADHLAEVGWQIVERNARFRAGEIDIVALEGTTLVFVEVKTRRTLVTGVPQAAVTPLKMRRLRALAGAYLMEHAPRHHEVRIDVVAVHVLGAGGCEIEHLRSVS